jgi:hypothetical protein
MRRALASYILLTDIRGDNKEAPQPFVFARA